METNKHGGILLGILLVGSGVGASGRAFGFAEDLCVKNNNTIRSPIENCLQARFCSEDDAGETDACRANITMDAGIASMTMTGQARSMLHTDATFFLAQVAGLSYRAAYWIAAYDQVTDVETYIPFGMFGQETLVDSKGMPAVPIALNGWGRSWPDTGGFSVHFPQPYLPKGDDAVISCDGGDICGRWPDVTDHVHEPMLFHLRLWAFDELDSLGFADPTMPCINGLTSLDDEGNYALGSECYENDPLFESDPCSTERHIVGSMPSFTSLNGAPTPFTSYTGNQVASFIPRDEVGEGKCISSPTYANADGLRKLMETAYGADIEAVLGGYSIEEFLPLIRMGIYLHSLQDRISHSQCEDASPYGPPDINGVFHLDFSRDECTGDYHAWRHFEEIGQTEVPERTHSALENTMDELEAFADANPLWVSGGAYRYSSSPGDYQAFREEALSRMIDVLETVDGCTRLREMVKLIHDYEAYGFKQLPGHDYDELSGMCLHQDRQAERPLPDPSTPIWVNPAARLH